MPLAPGQRIGNYELVSPLGAGGMGEVYRARDTRLDRPVAIKSLPAAFARDPERVARFEREARLLASLDHAHIAGIHGIEDLDGASYLVLEFIEGETLSQRLARGPLTVRETLEVAGHVAAALEAAHDRGIVHRDLKPGNVMLTPGRGAKVLDFGLAKSDGRGSSSSPDLTATPTVAMATADGIILGTAPYMSPEQARGKAVDRRADVWALGCLIFECLTGRQVFAGETSSDVIARILEREPEWTALPAGVPPRLRELARRCLTKDPESRPRDVGDLRRELASIATELSAPSGIAFVASATPSLAVLYFENLSSDAESDYFCAGITEDILTDLSKIKGLRVASRNAVARYRGQSPDIAKVASELGVGAVVEGSVRRAGGRVRISAQLINAADGFHLWAERFDRTLEDVFAVQEEIASSIAKALRVALTPKEAEAIAQDRPQDVRAYDLYLKGREQYGKYTLESLRSALQWFQEAIAVDPEYARAHAGIADCYGQMLQWDIAENREETIRLGLEAAQQAVTLHPGLAEGHKATALVLRFAGDDTGARAALLRALEADPRHLPAISNLAIDELFRGNLASAERLNRRCNEIDPEHLFSFIWLSFLLEMTDRLDRCQELLDRLPNVANDLNYVVAKHGMLFSIETRRNDWDAAQRRLTDAVAAGVTGPQFRALEALLLAARGRTEEAKRALADAEAFPTLTLGPLICAAIAALRVGDREQAARFVGRRVLVQLAPLFVRLIPGLHPLVDLPTYAPRRMDLTLTWPLEAPMIDAARFALFREVRIDTGLQQGTDLRVSRDR